MDVAHGGMSIETRQIFDSCRMLNINARCWVEFWIEFPIVCWKICMFGQMYVEVLLCMSGWSSHLMRLQHRYERQTGLDVSLPMVSWHSWGGQTVRGVVRGSLGWHTTKVIPRSPPHTPSPEFHMCPILPNDIPEVIKVTKYTKAQYSTSMKQKPRWWKQQKWCHYPVQGSSGGWYKKNTWETWWEGWKVLKENKRSPMFGQPYCMGQKGGDPWKQHQIKCIHSLRHAQDTPLVFLGQMLTRTKRAQPGL